VPDEPVLAVSHAVFTDQVRGVLHGLRGVDDFRCGLLVSTPDVDRHVSPVLCCDLELQFAEFRSKRGYFAAVCKIGEAREKLQYCCHRYGDIRVNDAKGSLTKIASRRSSWWFYKAWLCGTSWKDNSCHRYGDLPAQKTEGYYGIMKDFSKR